MSDNVKVFFCEPIGAVMLRIQMVGEQSPRIFGPMPKADADAKAGELWAAGGVDFSSQDSIYRAPDGREFTLRDAPPGAMWDGDWLRCFNRTGPDGVDLIVKCPDGHTWHVDSRASNCTRKDDDKHRCWCRHGDVRKGEVHVDKNGDTCAAGAGSILTPKWHGFLHNNRLVSC